MLAKTARAASESICKEMFPFECEMIEACICSLSLFSEVRLRQVGISLKCAPGVWRED